MGFLADVFKVLGLVGFFLACTLLAHAVAYGLVSFADFLRKYLVCHKVSHVCEYGWQSLTGCGKTILIRETGPVCLVYLVLLVYLVSFVQPNKRDRPDQPDRPNEQDRLADFFSILLETVRSMS